MPTTTEAPTDYERERGKPLPSFNHGTTQASIIIALAGYRSDFSIVSELSLELPPAGLEGDGSPAGEALRVTPDICVYPKKAVDWM